MVHQKGVDDLLQAVRVLRESGRQLHAVLIGDGPEAPRLRSIASDLGDAVRFAGRVDDRDLNGLIRSSAVLVLPSTREGWGLAITEAAARGIPYVAYDIPAVREQHELLQGGLLVPPQWKSLAEGIAELLGDPTRADALGERGRAVAAEMSWAKSAAVAEEAIENAVLRFRGRDRAP
jgi:glycosyltransferase involved in cell wall biosynthesis